MEESDGEGGGARGDYCESVMLWVIQSACSCFDVVPGCAELALRLESVNGAGTANEMGNPAGDAVANVQQTVGQEQIVTRDRRANVGFEGRGERGSRSAGRGPMLDVSGIDVLDEIEKRGAGPLWMKVALCFCAGQRGG